jgi:hypothetical protein
MRPHIVLRLDRTFDQSPVLGCILCQVAGVFAEDMLYRALRDLKCIERSWIASRELEVFNCASKLIANVVNLYTVDVLRHLNPALLSRPVGVSLKIRIVLAVAKSVYELLKLKTI